MNHVEARHDRPFLSESAHGAHPQAGHRLGDASEAIRSVLSRDLCKRTPMSIRLADHDLHRIRALAEDHKLAVSVMLRAAIAIGLQHLSSGVSDLDEILVELRNKGITPQA